MRTGVEPPHSKAPCRVASKRVQTKSVPAVFKPRNPVMSIQPNPVVCEIEIQEGEKLRLPESLVANIGPGRWIVSVQPAAVRDHSAFLNSYAPEDEGLYDAYPSR